jgi:hypothetical protein
MNAFLTRLVTAATSAMAVAATASAQSTVNMAGWQTWGGITAAANSSTTVTIPAGQTGVSAFAYAELSYEALGDSYCSELRMRVEIPGSTTQFIVLSPTGAPGAPGPYSDAGPGTVAGGAAFAIPAGATQLKVFVYESFNDGGDTTQDAEISSGTLTISYGAPPPPPPGCVEAATATVGSTPFSTAGGASGQLVETSATGGTATIYGPQWFKFTPAVTSNYEISVCGSAGDTKIAIGTDCPAAATVPMATLGYNDDSCECTSGCGTAGNAAWSSRLNLGNTGRPLLAPLQAGTTYRILVGGFGTTTGPVSGTMVISTIAPPPPPSDCANPVNAVLGTNTVSLDANGASLFVDCAFDGNPVSKPGYLRFVAPTTGAFAASTCTESIDTVMAAMTICGDETSIFACDDDGCTGGAPFNSRLVFEATQGQVVFIAVGLWSTTAAPPADGIDVVIEETLPPIDPCIDPVVATVGVNQLPMSPAAPNFNITWAGVIVWKCNFMEFTPTQSGIFTVSNCDDSSFDSWVITATACNDADSVLGGGRGQCLQAPGPGITTFDGQAGVTYYIGVGGYSAASVYPEVSTVEISAQYCTEGFDPCAAPLTVTNGVNTVPIDCGAPNLDLSCCWFPEFGFPEIAKANFVKYVAPSSGTVTVSACGQCVDSRLAVLASCTTSPDASVFIAADDDGCEDACFSSSLTFEASAGSTYYIAIGGYIEAGGEETLPAEMSIDIFSPINPCDPSVVGTAVIGNNVVTPSGAFPALDVTGSPCTFPFAPQAIAQAQYLKFTPTATGLHLFEQCADTGGTVDARMGILTSCGDASTFLICDDDGCTGGAPFTSRFEIELQAGTTYYLVVGGYSSAQTGPFNVLISGPGANQCIPDINDDGIVNGDDLGILLGQWGPCTACSADFNNNGFVNGDDLGQLLGAWGPCP